MPGYHWYGYNRALVNIRARRGSGGTGILIKDYLFDHFYIDVIDRTFDGIIGLQMIDKVSQFTIIIFSCYLPPDNSPYATNVNDFFAHLTCQSYLYSNADVFLICGDFNARVGNLKDTICCDTEIPDRKIIDMCHSNVYGHGETFVDFLLENKLCILNGRVTPAFDNYTSISVRGKAVVDYFVTRHDCFNMFNKVQVETSTDLVDRLDLLELISNDCKPPDHSLVSVSLNVASVIENYNCLTSNVNCNSTIIPPSKRFKFADIPDDFQNNRLWKESVAKICNNLITCTYDQQESDRLYSKFCCLLTNEMELFLKYKCTFTEKNNRKDNKICKPYWTNDLTVYWKDMKNAENRFLKNARTGNRHLMNDFYSKRKLFMRELRKAERSYWQSQMQALDNACTNDPKKFWQFIKKLGPKKTIVIPEKVYINNMLTADIDIVMKKWREDFQTLYNVRDANAFDAAFYCHAKNSLTTLEENMVNGMLNDNRALNLPISFQEVQYMLNKLKKNKATGIDNIPNEMLMNNDVVKILFNLYSKCFETSVIPSDWHKAIISPIPKNSSKDPHVPTNYRAISLLSCVCKGYTNILNNRLTSYYETSNSFANEQNGFRAKRACIDHIFSLTAIIRNRLASKEPTFACFIDFQKAFDFVDRDLLLYRLLLDNVNGKIYLAIKSLYDYTLSSIRLNGKFTDYFNINYGVRQGDSLSTTLFSAFINNLASDINSLNLGINIDEYKVSTLFYADDIVLIAKCERELQLILNAVDAWCKKWRMTINIDKTNIVHFRPRNTNLTEFNFKIGNSDLDKVNRYKYLGIMIDEFLTFNDNAELLSGAANRALGSIINQFKLFKNAGYKAFSKLFNTNVCSILDYCSGVWGNKAFHVIDKVQYRAQRWYLGVHNKTPLHAIAGDMGWDDSLIRRHISILRLWNRLIKMDNSRIAKMIFMWDKRICRKNWNYDAKSILEKIDCSENFDNNTTIDLKLAATKLRNIMSLQWKEELNAKPKLRTYVKFKENYGTESYVKFCMNRTERSLIAQIRSGTLPINIEVGRFRQIDIENRLCSFCDLGVIEDEIHFVTICPLYDDCRALMYSKISDNDFFQYSNEEKFIFLIENKWKLLAKYMKAAWDIRKKRLYND